MSAVTPEWLKHHQTSGSVEDANNNLKFDVHAAESKLFQSEYELGPDGQEVFRDTREIEWILGAGEITEILVQSTPDEITVLPALPRQWPTGSLKGVRVRVVARQTSRGKTDGSLS